MKNTGKSSAKLDLDKVNFAGATVRLCAYVIDLIIVGLVGIFMARIALVIWLRNGINEAVISWTDKGVEEALVLLSGNGLGVVILTWLIAVYAVFLIMYFAVLPATKHQATPGMMLLDIKIIDEQGNKISFLRSLARLIVFKIGLSLIIPVVVIFFNKHKRQYHDYICGTYMIHDFS